MKYLIIFFSFISNLAFSQCIESISHLILCEKAGKGVFIYDILSTTEKQIYKFDCKNYRLNKDSIFLFDETLYIRIQTSKVVNNGKIESKETEFKIDLRTFETELIKQIIISKDSTFMEIKEVLSSGGDTIVYLRSASRDIYTERCYSESNTVDGKKVISLYGVLYTEEKDSVRILKETDQKIYKSCKLYQGYVFPSLSCNGNIVYFWNYEKSKKSSNYIDYIDVMSGEEGSIAVRFKPICLEISDNNYIIYKNSSLRYFIFDIENKKKLRISKYQYATWLSNIQKVKM